MRPFPLFLHRGRDGLGEQEGALEVGIDDRIEIIRATSSSGRGFWPRTPPATYTRMSAPPAVRTASAMDARR